MLNLSHFESLIELKIPEISKNLHRNSLKLEDLEALEAKANCKLPDDIRGFYLAFNGQDLNSPYGFFFNWDFLSIAAVGNVWETWVQTAITEGANAQFAGQMSSNPKGHIQEVYFCQGWIPFAADGCGNFIAVDTEPAAAGNFGQVILAGLDHDEKRVLATSFKDFLEQFCKILVSDSFSLDKEFGFEPTLDADNPLADQWDWT